MLVSDVDSPSWITQNGWEGEKERGGGWGGNGVIGVALGLPAPGGCLAVWGHSRDRLPQSGVLVSDCPLRLRLYRCILNMCSGKSENRELTELSPTLTAGNGLALSSLAAGVRCRPEAVPLHFMYQR